MKKFFTLLAALFVATTMMGQMHGPMKFVGASNMSVSSTSNDNPSDTILFEMADSDLGNILIVFFNVPIVYVGAKYVFRATRHYKKNDGTPFTSEVIGRNDCAYWDEQAKKVVKNFSEK